jgi:rubrerythrin
MLYTCEHCKHTWEGRVKRAPKSCPRCKRYDYKEPKNDQYR